ncbi:HXXEE domain-containing protein [Streptomyces sp. NPDC090036]|uniref:HXXEE domain-containing protein n=1 Tax=Streptomyces sp. NPDC090036 TaxID=3365926 RepID=UPI0038164AEE
MNASPTGPAISRSAVTLGLLAAWTVHDLEEVATMARWSRTRVPALRERHPRVPDRIWRSMEAVDGREFATAVGVMGLIVAAASADGYRTGGRSSFYQASLNGFGLHGLVHMAQAAATRGYTPGVVTSPLLVVPFTLWARGRLRRAGVLRPARARDIASGLALAGAATAAAHAVARRIRRAAPARQPRVRGLVLVPRAASAR